MRRPQARATPGHPPGRPGAKKTALVAPQQLQRPPPFFLSQIGWAPSYFFELTAETAKSRSWRGFIVGGGGLAGPDRDSPAEVRLDRATLGRKKFTWHQQSRLRCCFSPAENGGDARGRCKREKEPGSRAPPRLPLRARRADYRRPLLFLLRSQVVRFASIYGRAQTHFPCQRG